MDGGLEGPDDLAGSEPPETGPSARVKCGVDWELENAADELLIQSRKGISKVSEKKDFLTADQLERRRNREIYNETGTPEAELFLGIYRRAWNPLAGTRPTKSENLQRQGD